MAVGAKPSHLLMQFLVEALALSTVGGVLGTAIGVFAARTLATRLGWPFSTRFEMILLAFGFSVVVGVGFGLYPARKAALLEPIDALRYE
jgi:putative ABC transport system permease protein